METPPAPSFEKRGLGGVQNFHGDIYLPMAEAIIGSGVGISSNDNVITMTKPNPS